MVSGGGGSQAIAMEVDEACERAGGRDYLELRASRCEVGIAGCGSGKVEGSVRLSSGRTAVAVEVKGPESSPSGAPTKPTAGRDGLLVTVRSIVRPISGLAGEREQDLESKVVSFVEGILDPSCPPRTTVTVVVQILSEDGSLLATILNATATALVEAGVPLFGSPVAVSIAVADSGTPRVRLDPDLREESTCELVGTYAYLFVTEGDQTGASVVQASSMGRSSAETAMLALATAEKAAEAVFHSRRGGEE